MGKDIVSFQVGNGVWKTFIERLMSGYPHPFFPGVTLGNHQSDRSGPLLYHDVVLNRDGRKRRTLHGWMLFEESACTCRGECVKYASAAGDAWRYQR